MNKVKLLSLILALLMIVSTVACNPSSGGEETTGNGTSETTESSVTDTKETESGDGTETTDPEGSSEATEDTGEETTEEETDRPLDTTPITLPEIEDEYPEIQEGETVDVLDFSPISIKIEGEKYDSINMPTKNVVHSDFSGGETLRVHCGSSSLENGWDGVYQVTYNIKLPQTGVYAFQAVTHQLVKEYTSDYTITIDGNKTIDAAAVGQIAESIPATIDGRVDSGLIKRYAFGDVELSGGEHTVTFTVDTEDAQESQNRVIFFLDYFTFEMSSVGVMVEGEKYDSINMPTKNVVHSDYSGGETLRVHCGASSLENGWDGVYQVSYTINVAETGLYELRAMCHQLGMVYTSDFVITVDDTYTIDAAEVGLILENKPAMVDGNLDKSLIKLYSFGEIELEAGEHKVTFTVDTEDAQESQERIILFLDYFSLNKASEVKEGIYLDYAVEIEGENSDILKSAATVSVYDCSYPLNLTINHLFAADGELSYSIVDYFGDKLYEGKLEGKKGQMVNFSRTFKAHPTGYFMLNVGEETSAYVVTPALKDRTLTDSPFAMDFASTYLAQDLKTAEALASAARLAGITWVRERASWATYESKQGVYDFTYTEERFKMLDRVGLNTLVMVEGAPKWAVQDLNTDMRTGGYLRNQLSTYNMTKAMAAYYKGIVDAWELSNEPDGGRAETAEQFASWFKAAALGVNAGDPDVIISNAGFCQPDRKGTTEEPNLQYSYVHLALANGIMAYSSVFNFHNHTPQSSNRHTPIYGRISYALASQMYSTTTLYGANKKPVWITESGMKMMSETPTQENILDLAPYVVTSTTQSLGFGTEKHFWFVLAPYLESEGDFGSFSDDLQPYSTMAAEAVMTKVLGEAKYVGELTDGIENFNYARGLLFNRGDRIVSVLWTFVPSVKYTYTFDSEHPVIVTDLMGNETLVEPTDGKISVTVGKDPVYITYSTPPADYIPQKQNNAKIEPLTFDAEDKIIITPEFTKYDIEDNYTKLNGHLIYDGLRIRVHIGNYNDFAVTGSVSLEIPGYEIEGCGKEVTIEPFTEKVLALTLKKTDDVEIYDFFTIEGSFGDYKVKSVVQLRSMETVPVQSVTFPKIVEAIENREYPLDKYETVVARVENASGTPYVYLNSKQYDNFTFDGSEIKISTEGLGDGKYILTAAILSEGGDYLSRCICFRIFNGNIVFNIYP